MRRLAAILGLAALAACNTDVDQSTRPDNIAGTYHLASLGGAPLPVPVAIDSTSFQLESGELVMTADGSWTESLTFTTVSRTGGRQATMSSGGGTWIILRDQAYIAFMDRLNSYSFSGVGSGNQIVLRNLRDEAMVYRR